MTEMTPDAMELPEVHVIDVRTPIFRDQDAPDDPSYTRENASTANRSNVPIMQTPIAVQVVPRAVLRDQQAIQIGDAVKNVSGVFPGFTFGGLAEEFMIRGFNTGYVSYRDGFRVPAVRLSLANIERVEVVKGAAANLYGRVEPGGMINLVTKRPQAESYYSLQQRFGSYAEYQTLADATGKLNQSGTLLYRINFEYLNKESYRDFGFHTRTFAAPTVTWRVTERTQLDVDFMYSGEGTREDYGIVALGTGPAPLPRSRFLGEPTDKVRMDVYNSVASLTHAFTADWQARARFNYFRRNVGDPQTFGTSLNELTGELQRGFYRGNAVNNTYMGTVDLTGKFVTGPLAHKMLAGWEYYGNFAKVNSISADASPINIFTPQYSTNNQSLQPYNFFIDQKVDWTGLYAQDQITLFDKLHLLGGGRYDWASQGTGTAFGTDQSLASAAAAVKTINNSRFSPRAGIVYQPWEWLSFYGNYAQSLGAANAAFDASGNTLKPEIGEQFEGGVKTSFFGGRLHSSVAVYQLTKQNMAVPVAGLPFSTPIGEARSKGIEVDVSGQIAQGLSLVMTYAYTDARSLTGDNEGKRLWNVPTNAGSLWARYEPQARLWQGLSLGAGVFVQDKRAGDNTNTFYLPSQARVDAMVRYRPSILESRLSFQLNAYNLANDYLYGGTLNDRFSLNVDIPRMFIGSIQYAL
ncbi:TonB-dependent siderophore receptor [Nitrospira japonica]|nr:TonB-dependent siderophore receptor [Nitrospira japonica]